MSANDALEQAVLAWRTKHQVREDGPILAVLDLVRVYLAHAPLPARNEAELPPSYETAQSFGYHGELRQ
jgi:hypothetical protein